MSRRRFCGRALPVAGLEDEGLLSTSMSSKVGSSSRIMRLRLSREMSRSRSPQSPCWPVVSGAGSNRMVWPTLRTWWGIMWVMPSAAGIMLGEPIVLRDEDAIETREKVPPSERQGHCSRRHQGFGLDARRRDHIGMFGRKLLTFWGWGVNCVKPLATCSISM